MEFNPEIIKKFRYNDVNSYKNNLLKADSFLRLKQAISENWFFEIYELNNIESTEWFKIDFGFSASNFQLCNDSSDIFLFSWNGAKIDGLLNSGETLPFNQLERKEIYIKANGKIRIWCY